MTGEPQVLMCPVFMNGAGCWHYEELSLGVPAARRRMVGHLWPGNHGGQEYSRESAERMTQEPRPRSKAKIEKSIARERRRP